MTIITLLFSFLSQATPGCMFNEDFQAYEFRPQQWSVSCQDSSGNSTLIKDGVVTSLTGSGKHISITAVSCKNKCRKLNSRKMSTYALSTKCTGQANASGSFSVDGNSIVKIYQDGPRYRFKRVRSTYTYNGPNWGDEFHVSGTSCRLILKSANPFDLKKTFKVTLDKDEKAITQ